MTAEALNTGIDNLAALQDGRYNLAVQASNEQLLGAFEKDRITYPDVMLASIKNDGSSYTMYGMSSYANELIGCEAVGLEPREVIEAGKNDLEADESRIVKTFTVGDTFFEMSAMRDRLKFRVASPASSPKVTGDYDLPQGMFRDAVSQRFAASPAHQAMQQAQIALKASPDVPASFRTTSFDPAIDPLGSLAFLEDIGAASYLRLPMQSEPDQAKVLVDVLAGKHGVELELTETDNETILTWGKGTIRRLVTDKQTGNCYYEATQNPSYFYVEAASKPNNREHQAVPFIETVCAAELSAVLDAAGLMFSPRMQANMMSPHAENSMGSVYTEMTRELAKGIDRPERLRLSNLFAPYDETMFGDALAQKISQGKFDGARSLSSHVHDALDDSAGMESADAVTAEAIVRTMWQASLHDADGKAARTLLGMIDDALVRPSGTPLETSLPVTSNKVEFSTGACGDVAGYFIKSANEATLVKVGRRQMVEQSKSLQAVAEDGINFLQKRLGTNTSYLSIESMVFNGVRLPKGALFTKGDDGGWAFLRLTPFAFDDPEDQVAAAGSEIPERVVREQQFGHNVGGITLSRFVELAIPRQSLNVTVGGEG